MEPVEHRLGPAGAPFPQTIISASITASQEPPGREFRHAAGLPFPLGTLLRDRYELISVIGSGGMGVVYRALDHLHEQMNDQRPYVAVKVLNERFRNNSSALISLQRETRKAQLLAHENIVSVHNFDRHEQSYFMTMELLEGQSLKELLAETAGRGVPPLQATEIVQGVAHALAYAHENGFVHSDLKPSNVFREGIGRVKVLDFGVARAMPESGASGPHSRALDPEQLSGFTPAYSSPETLAGEPPAPSDDVFALAVVTLELVLGRHPNGSRPMDADVLEKLDHEVLRGFSRPQRRALTRALAVQRNDRPKNAKEFSAEFESQTGLSTIAITGFASAMLFAGIALWTSLQEPMQQPGVPFEDLPAGVQAEFETAVSEGTTALGFGSAALSDALHYFSAAWDLHPGNARAIAGLERVADSFIDSIDSAGSDTRSRVYSTLYCQPYLRTYAPVAATCVQALGESQCDAIAARCQLSSGE